MEVSKKPVPFLFIALLLVTVLVYVVRMSAATLYGHLVYKNSPSYSMKRTREKPFVITREKEVDEEEE